MPSQCFRLHIVRGHVQTIFGKISVIMTFFCLCIAFFLLTITPRFPAIMPIYSTGHFIAELTLYQMLESGKDTSLHRPDDSGNV